MALPKGPLKGFMGGDSSIAESSGTIVAITGKSCEHTLLLAGKVERRKRSNLFQSHTPGHDW